jgi:hypothetical protein
MAKVGQKLQKSSGREAVTSFVQGKEDCLFLVEVRGWGSIYVQSELCLTLRLPQRQGSVRCGSSTPGQRPLKN